MCARFIGIAEEPYIDEARSRRIVPEMLIERLQVDSFVVPPPRPSWLLYRIMGYRAWELRSFNHLSSHIKGRPPPSNALQLPPSNLFQSVRGTIRAARAPAPTLTVSAV